MILVTNTPLLCVVVQLCLTFGFAGLFFPEKLLRIFEVLMYPWTASKRLLQVQSIAALGMALLLLAALRLR